MAREPKMNLVSANNSKGVVLTMEEAPNSTTITLLDSNEYIIYSEKLSENSRGKRIDMENLNDGTYYFKTEHDLKTITYTIEIMGNEVTIVNRDEKVKPYFRKENKKVFMNFLNLDKSKVLIKVYDENRLVFTETISEELIIEKAFNFEGAYGGNYVLIVEDNNEIYSEELVVK
jgi:flagellar hook assembly protein FlgD